MGLSIASLFGGLYAAEGYNESDGATGTSSATLVVPIISPSDGEVRRLSDTRIEMLKPEGIIVSSNMSLSFIDGQNGRVFNVIAGVEAIPLFASLSLQAGLNVEREVSVVGAVHFFKNRSEVARERSMSEMAEYPIDTTDY